MVYLIVINNKTKLIKYLNNEDMTKDDFYKSYIFYKFNCPGYNAIMCRSKL